MDDYKNGWRYIVWVDGNDDYYKTFSLELWIIIIGEKKVMMCGVYTEIQKDGTEKIVYNSERLTSICCLNYP